MIIILYLDEFILTSDEKLNRSFKEYIQREFEMKYMGIMNYFLRLEVWKGDVELFVSHEKCYNKIHQIFYMENCKYIGTPLATN